MIAQLQYHLTALCHACDLLWSYAIVHRAVDFAALMCNFVCRTAMATNKVGGEGVE